MVFKVPPNPKRLGFYGNLLPRPKQSDLELSRECFGDRGLGCVTPGKEMEVTVGCACGEMLQL